MNRVIAMLAWTTALVLLATAAPAEASSAPLGTVIASGAASPARTDGQGVLAYVPSAGTVRVLTAGSSFDVDVSGGCAAPPQYVTAVGEDRCCTTARSRSIRWTPATRGRIRD